MRKNRKSNPAFLAQVWRKHLRQRARNFRRSLVETQASERRFREAIHFMPIPIGIADRQGRVLAHNQMFTEVFGYTLEDIPTVVDWMKLAYPDETYRQQSLATWQADLESAQEQGLPIPSRLYDVVCKDGRRCLVEITTQAVGDLLVTTFIDVTARKQAERERDIALAKYQTLFETFPLGISVTDELGNILETNQAAEKLLAVPQEEHTRRDIGSPAWRIIREDGTPMPREEFASARALAEKRLVENVRMGILTLDETVTWINVTAAPLPVPGYGVVVTYSDISAQRRAEQALRDSEVIFSSFLEHSPIYVFFKDKNVRSLHLSKNYEQMLGMPVSQALGKNMEELFPSELAHSMVADDLRILNEGQPVHVVEELNDRVYETTKFPIFIDGKPEMLAGFTLDVTDRVRIERALRESEARYRTLFEQANDAIFVEGGNDQIVDVNQRACELLGYTREELLQMRVPDLIAPEVGRRRHAVQAEFAIHGSKPFESIDVHKDGRRIMVEVTNALLPNGLSLSIVRDITARKESENKVRESEALLRNLINSMPDIVCFKDGAGHWLEANDFDLQLFELTGVDYRGKKDSELAADSPFYQQAFLACEESDEQAWQLGCLSRGEEVIPRPDGSAQVFDIIKVPTFGPSGERLGLIVVGRDITEHKRAESALRESERRFRILFEHAGVGVAQIDSLTGKFIQVNQKYCDIVGYTCEEMQSLDFQAITHPADLQADLDLMESLKRGEIPEFMLEKRYFRKDGSLVWVNLIVSPLWSVGQAPDTHIAVVHDITERKRAEDELRESEKRFRVLFENAGVGVAQGETSTGRFLKINQKYCDIVGYTREEMEQLRFASITHPDDLAKNLALLEQLKRGEIQEFTLEKRYIRKDGSLVWVLLTVSPLWSPGEKPETHITIVFDITEQKRAEESLRASEKKYRQLSSLLRLMADTMPDMLWAKNLEREYIFANQAICETLLNATDTSEPLGNTDLFFAARERAAHPENPEWHTFGEICHDSDAITLAELKPLQFDEFGNVKGEFLYLDVHKAPLYDDDGELIGLVGSARDVTARKQAETALKESAERTQLQRNALAQLTLNETIAQSDISEALKEITRMIAEVLRVARASVWSLSADNAELYCLMLSENGLPPRAVNQVLQVADYPRYFEALIQESILNAADAYRDPRTAEFTADYLPRFKIDAMLDVAIQREGRLVAVICAEHTGGARAWQSDESSFLSAVAHFTAQLFAQAERKRVEQALRESEERYRSLFAQMLDGVYRSTRAGKFVEINPAMVKMFGYASQEEMLEIDIKRELYFDPAERDSPLLAHGKRGTEIYRMRRKDGSEIWVEDHGYYVRDERGDIIFHEGILRDVTEKVQAEAALRQSELLYRQAIMAVGAVPYRQSYQHREDLGTRLIFDFVGEGIRELTGYSTEEFNDQVWDEVVQESILVEELAAYEFREAIWRVRSGQLPVWKCEHRIRTRDGKTRWVFEAAVELPGEDGISQGSIGIYQDVTARKLAEERILQLNADLERRVQERTSQLENANKELEAFAYSVSHDLRAPLRAIDGFSRILMAEHGDQLNAEALELLERVRSANQQMTQLVDALLGLSRMTRTEMRRETLDLSLLARRVIENLRHVDPDRQVQFSIAGQVVAEGDLRLLSIVLENLLGNAWKFTSRRENAQIEFGAQQRETERVYFVRDNGAGFNPRYADKLFGAFQRLHTSSEFEGTGIGLATVQRIIHRHGGKVWAESEVGQGATFYFTLGEARLG